MGSHSNGVLKVYHCFSDSVVFFFFFLVAVVTFSLMATRYNLPVATTSKKMTIKEIHDLPTENSKKSLSVVALRIFAGLSPSLSVGRYYGHT